MKEFLEKIIKTGNYRLEDMEFRIKKLFATGDLTDTEMAELLTLACEYADDTKQIDISAILADLEKRIEVLESAGVVVWKSGMAIAKGQTVLYAIVPGDSTLRYCRYDGGRASTSLRPGKIDGWVVLASAGGEVTHRIEKDADSNIILVPVNNDSNEE